ncbi:MAG: Gfo/Idh/MocA family oxidoreductase [Planctomycetales bacterium]|nr:Gfo/Idh/MocA family oxidoreductase [Planctomycetales bacterium]
MKPAPQPRREFLKTTGTAAAAAAIVGASMKSVHAAGDGVIQVALVGCGGRGTGAATNALSVKNGQTKLVAMADVFEHRQKASYASLSQNFPNQCDVPEDKRFIGFEAYKNAMDCLRPGDVVILATPPAFRWLHFTYAIEKGLNVFMEKPVTVDAPTSVRMFDLAKQAEAKNLKVGVGLMCRHCRARGEAADRIHNGELGDIVTLRAYRMAGPTASAASGPNPGNMSDLMYQISRFHSFLWLSGGAVSDFLIHNIDEACWVKNDWPVKAIASGGRHYRGNDIDQNFDTYSIEYTFADGAKLLVNGRTIPGCFNEFATFAHGTKGSAVFSTAGHIPARSRFYSSQDQSNKNLIWQAKQPEPNPYQLEWDDLIDAIKNDKPYNEVERGVKSSLVTSMGRMAAHTGQLITYDDMLDLGHEFAPDLAKLTLDGPSPLMPDKDGKYPIPMPGIVKDREY